MGKLALRLLLDTHACLWWLAGDTALSPSAREAIEDDRNAILFSAASAWEMATKHRIGKLPGVAALVDDLEGALRQQGFASLAIDIRHAQAAGALPRPHRDPFDRMLIAQALLEDLALVSNERGFDAYGVTRIW